MPPPWAPVGTDVWGDRKCAGLGLDAEHTLTCTWAGEPVPSAPGGRPLGACSHVLSEASDLLEVLARAARWDPVAGCVQLPRC